MGKQDAGKHDIHNRSMIGDKNVLLIFIFLLIRKLDQVIPETHSIEHSEAPEAYKLIRILVMFFAKG